MTVCTANICRSPAAAVLLRRGLATTMPGAVVTSAGVAALEGMPACDVSAALVGADAGPSGELARHAAHKVTRADLESADLILALDRSHRSVLAQLLPTSRSRTFTLRQAGAAATAMIAAMRDGELPDGAPPLPEAPDERFRWWVGELDALRSYADPGDTAGKRPITVHALDVPDPHVLGSQHHPMAIELIETAVSPLLESLRIVTEFVPQPR